MRADAYTDQAGWGFSLDTIRTNEIEGRYFERFETTEKFFDPFGKEQVIKRVAYQTTSFRLIKQSPQLELHDAPRSVAAFVNQMGSYLDFSLAVQDRVVKVESWYKAIQSELPSILVSSLNISEVTLSPSVYARVALVGSQDVRKFVKTMTGGRSYSFERFQFAGVLADEPFKCEIHSEARATVLSGNSQELLPVLRKTLQEILRDTPDV